MMNIDTERVIMEVQMHPVIWDTSFDLYKSKEARQIAWMDICTNLVDKFGDMSSGRKKAVVVFFQKKWKSVRDYYIREKKKEIETGGAPKKRKMNPYFKLLEFLSDPKQVNIKSNVASPVLLNDEDGNSPQKDQSSDNESSCDQSGSITNEIASSPVLTSTETVSTQIIVSRQSNQKTEPYKDDPNRHFLLSVLPEMSNMSDRQNFKFRLEIMKALNKVKYQIAE